MFVKIHVSTNPRQTEDQLKIQQVTTPAGKLRTLVENVHTSVNGRHTRSTRLQFPVSLHCDCSVTDGGAHWPGGLQHACASDVE